MKVYVGITDMDWYRALAAQPEVREVNYWKPGGEGGFKALLPGEPFLFKTKWDHNKIVGGGYFQGYARLPLSQAWDFFGIGNGVSNLQELTALVSKYRDVRVHLAHRQLRVGVRNANIGAERQLHATAEGVTAQGGNHRHRHFLPHPADLLGEVRDAVAFQLQSVEPTCSCPTSGYALSVILRRLQGQRGWPATQSKPNYRSHGDASSGSFDRC